MRQSPNETAVQSMRLFHRENTQHRGSWPLVVLHGLLGSSQNWGRLLSGLEGKQTVYALDMRNHGQSPWASEMNFPLMVEDVLHWMRRQGVERAHMLGHSLGGKVVLQLACRFPQHVASLNIVDIAPKPYPPHHQKIFEALNGLPLGEIKSRRQADELLAASIESEAMRGFLLTNLARTEDGSFYWRPNIEALSEAKNVEEISQSPVVEGDQYNGPCWWLKGEASPYIREKDSGVIHQHAPRAHFESWEGIGHNPHTEAPERFQERLMEHLNSIASVSS